MGYFIIRASHYKSYIGKGRQTEHFVPAKRESASEGDYMVFETACHD